MDAETRSLLDSLDRRVIHLEGELPTLLKTKSPSWFYKKRELDHTLFLKQYHSYLFEEDLESADALIESRLKGAKKRADKASIDFFLEYQRAIVVEKKEHQKHYQELFAKEKNFRKELELYLNAKDEYAVERAIRMTELAIKYAEERQLEQVLEYLYKYQGYAQAYMRDFESDYDLNRLTSSENQFLKVFTPLVESDSLHQIQEAGKLVRSCYDYSIQTNTKLDTSFFLHHEKLVKTSLSDYYDREGNLANLSALDGQSIIAKVDSLNRVGIYKWHDMILVIGHFKPEAKFSSVQRGEAVIHADQKLIHYVRINKLAKIGKVVKLGAASIIPYQNADSGSPFQYNPENKEYQYMICYQLVENQKLTQQIRQLLPPLLFEQETENL